ncbi:MAG: hypothetical protein LRY51_05110 [Geovibrio sp.]|nr:hypothetical protein [Geovibrio sp.]
MVISASHNPYYDNGIKFFSSEGLKLPDEVELAIEQKTDSMVHGARFRSPRRISARHTELTLRSGGMLSL